MLVHRGSLRRRHCEIRQRRHHMGVESIRLTVLCALGCTELCPKYRPGKRQTCDQSTERPDVQRGRYYRHSTSAPAGSGYFFAQDQPHRRSPELPSRTPRPRQSIREPRIPRRSDRRANRPRSRCYGRSSPLSPPTHGSPRSSMLSSSSEHQLLPRAFDVFVHSTKARALLRSE